MNPKDRKIQGNTEPSLPVQLRVEGAEAMRSAPHEGEDMVRPVSKGTEAAGTRNEQPRLDEASNKSGLVPDSESRGGDLEGVPFSGGAPLRPIPYIAGFFDAEGTILLSDVRGWYQLHVKITNSCLEILKELKGRFGGHIQEKLGAWRRHRCWSWELTSLKESVPFLEAISPYLMTKFGQAHLAIEGAPVRFSAEARDRISDLNRGREEWGPAPARNLTNKESLQYMAGFFDGEGCVTIAKATPRRHWLQVRAGGTDLRTLEWIRDAFGGSLGKQTRYSNRHNQSWYWQLQASSAEEFLGKIASFSMIKRKQIELGIQFRRQCAQPPGANRLTDKQIQLRESFKQKLSRLNFSRRKKTVAS